MLKGQYHWANGNKFVGEFRAGLPGGEGVFETKSGDIFVGSFSNGLPNGQGTTLSSLLVQPSEGNKQESLCMARGRRNLRNMSDSSETACSTAGENTISMMEASMSYNIM